MSETPNHIIAIDPDVDKNGVAYLRLKPRLLELSSLTFPALLDYLQTAAKYHYDHRHDFVVLVEAGWLNKAHWHVLRRDSPTMAAAKGNSAGRNHEVGRLIAACMEHWHIPCKLVKPLSLHIGKRKMWDSTSGKITHEELASFMPVEARRTNQEERDAALLAWRYAGLPVKVKPFNQRKTL